MPFQAQFPFYKREESLADNNTVNALLAASGLGGAAGLGHLNNWDINRFNPASTEKIKLLLAAGFHPDTEKYLADENIEVTRKHPFDMPSRRTNLRDYANLVKNYDAYYGIADKDFTSGHGGNVQVPFKEKLKGGLADMLQKHMQPMFRQLSDYNRGSLLNKPNELNREAFGQHNLPEMAAKKDRYSDFVAASKDPNVLKEFGISAKNTHNIPNIPVGDFWKGVEHKVAPGNRGKVVVGLGGGWQIPAMLSDHLANKDLIFDEQGGLKNLTVGDLNSKTQYKEGILDKILEGFDKKYGQGNYDVYLPGGPGRPSGMDPTAVAKIDDVSTNLVEHLRNKYKGRNVHFPGFIPQSIADAKAKGVPHSMEGLYKDFTDMVFAPGSTTREFSQMRGGLGNLIPVNLPVMGDRSTTHHFADNSNWIKEQFPELTNVVDMNKPTFHNDLTAAIGKTHGLDTLRKNYSQVARPTLSYDDYAPVRQAIKNKVHMQKFKNLGGLALTAIPGLFGATNLLRNAATGMNA